MNLMAYDLPFIILPHRPKSNIESNRPMFDSDMATAQAGILPKIAAKHAGKARIPGLVR
jgi:hypothetical protein